MNRIEMLNFLLTQFSASSLLSDILGEMSVKEFITFVERIAKMWGLTLPCDCGVYGLEATCCKSEEYDNRMLGECCEAECLERGDDKCVRSYKEEYDNACAESDKRVDAWVETGKWPKE